MSSFILGDHGRLFRNEAKVEKQRDHNLLGGFVLQALIVKVKAAAPEQCGLLLSMNGTTELRHGNAHSLEENNKVGRALGKQKKNLGDKKCVNNGC
ncbi:hypothetical protein AMTR_s00127p00109100 [Amborella trichopoda]|uniref:Uncharacterized protein n=1 Tax=Amborella trichopoda TaxID=13333 RepID=W1NNP1_AMBTC|nr:hypothetical protein AMTR_s00127p00109100 [Amborella trichopoda]